MGIITFRQLINLTMKKAQDFDFDANCENDCETRVSLSYFYGEDTPKVKAWLRYNWTSLDIPKFKLMFGTKRQLITILPLQSFKNLDHLEFYGIIRADNEDGYSWVAINHK